jgi:hypothetical protein
MSVRSGSIDDAFLGHRRDAGLKFGRGDDHFHKCRRPALRWVDEETYFMPKTAVADVLAEVFSNADVKRIWGVTRDSVDGSTTTVYDASG